MPKFLYSIVLASLGLWILGGNMFFNTRPESTWRVIVFLFYIGAAATLTISIPAYFILAKKSPNFMNLRFLYRRAIKWGFFTGSFISIFLGLRAFNLASPLNLALLLVSYGMIFLQFRSSR